MTAHYPNQFTTGHLSKSGWKSLSYYLIQDDSCGFSKMRIITNSTTLRFTTFSLTYLRLRTFQQCKYN